jgi:hypothetical protein
MQVIVYFQLILGESLGKVWLFVSLAAIITETMACYGFLSNLISKRDDALQAIGLGIGSSIGLLNVYKLFSAAQKVEECVSMICFFNNIL